MQKREIQAYKIELNFVDTDLNYETFLGNNECWCCGHLNSIYIDSIVNQVDLPAALNYSTCHNIVCNTSGLNCFFQ